MATPRGVACQTLGQPFPLTSALCLQRGCGRSTPLGCLEDNNTAALVQDFEALREALGIDKWLLFGGSWGVTLSLAYARAHSHRCYFLNFE